MKLTDQHTSEIHKNATSGWTVKDNFYQQGEKFAVIRGIVREWERMRPKDAAPVMWRPCSSGELGHINVFTDGRSIGLSTEGTATHFLTLADLLSLPFPADPTPEEKAEAQFEAFWKTQIYGERDKDKCRLFFMAAKFPAGKEGK